MTAYYNENSPKAAASLRELISAGHIAPGIVDERSIEDVYPSDLRGFTQCHFFAGIGVWSYALRSAGWSDDRPVWTGSCPCQPFSAAGEGAGFDDERHLWPHFHHLIKECDPSVVTGEQVANKDADPWIDLVCADLEALGYAFGAVPFPSAGVGAPHIRDRTYWVAKSEHGRRQARQPKRSWPGAALPSGASGRLADCASGGRRKERSHAGGRLVGDRAQGIAAGLVHGGGLGWLGDADSERARRDGRAVLEALRGEDRQHFPGDAGAPGADDRPGPTNGLWHDADWLLCRDGRWRPVEPGTSPLAHGAPERVGRLHGYGNAINAEAAKAFIEAVMETQP